MFHRISGRKLGRNIKQRKALFRNLINSLILAGRIRTTEAKAKAVKGLVDKLVTKAKKKTLWDWRQLLGPFPQKSVEKLIKEIVPRFENRSSGFTRLIKIGSRPGDQAPQVLLEWVEGKETALPKETPKGKKKKAKDDKTNKSKRD